MASYDDAEVTERERLAAQRQNTLAQANAANVADQLRNQIGTYDAANRQNRRLADIQTVQAKRKGVTERSEADRDLQNAALGLLANMGQAMNGSALGNLMRMLESRSDKDNVTHWEQQQENLNNIENAYNESANQNNISALEAYNNAVKAQQDIRVDTAANKGNLNPNLYENPEDIDLGPGADLGPAIQPNRLQRLSGYLMPENSVQNARARYPRNRVAGNDYFARLINGFNGRQ